MRIETSYRKRWKRAIFTILLLFVLFPIQQMLFNRLPNILFELSNALFALMVYGVVICFTRHSFQGQLQIFADKDSITVARGKKVRTIALQSCRSLLLSKTSFLGEQYYILYIKCCRGRPFRVVTMPTEDLIFQHPFAELLNYICQESRNTHIAKYERYWELILSPNG